MPRALTSCLALTAVNTVYPGPWEVWPRALELATCMNALKVQVVPGKAVLLMIPNYPDLTPQLKHRELACVGSGPEIFVPLILTRVLLAYKPFATLFQAYCDCCLTQDWENLPSKKLISKVSS